MAPKIFPPGPLPIQDAGAVLTPGDPDYDAARRMWNGAVDKRPAYIARCATPEQVRDALQLARDKGLPVAVRSGGGHSIAGLSTCDGGVMIDLSPMKDVRVDPVGRRALAGAGVLGGELDRASQVHGLATTLGTVSHTGVAGLTLGGGMGWLMRQHGLASDNVLSLRAVLADGRIVRASAEELPELFWALRGGGGQIAVVTELEYELHPVGPQIGVAQFVFAPENGLPALKVARDLAVGSDRGRNMWLGYMSMPDDPELPPELRDRFVYVIMSFSTDPADATGQWLAPLSALQPLMVDTEPHDYAELQSMFDEDNRHGVCAYSKGAYVGELNDSALEVFAEQARQAQGEALVYLQQMGGAVAQVGDSAVQGRAADYVLNAIMRWTDPADADRARTWARELVEAMRPHSLTTAPLNFEGDVPGDGGPRPVVVYGDAAPRLQAIKRMFDPDGVLGVLRP